MGVPCPGCDREYDVALFAFGRTIHCTCGRRVGLEVRVRGVDGGSPPRFFADAMLGRLARWLRILGFDVAYEAHIADGELARRAVEQGRQILTRDRALPLEWRVSGVYVVAAERPFEQLREVVEAFDLGGAARPFTRCNRCNAPLVAASRGEVDGQVPARVLARHDRFQRCTHCDRVYWAGSHIQRMEGLLEKLLSERASGPGETTARELER
ncbi:MAG: Mut7-C RNAse domain-containing protein [Deltaproteobacteria bacterium]|nr:Mut7-C RNAse domain-containing protein [Deltaproteobacteria bacterium]MBW2418790.1 Mut7-C RNAse domain-containing protein [Deltaproteobacteria bacterium]